MVATAVPNTTATAQDTIALVADACQALEPESCALEQSLNRTLRERVVAPEDQPLFDRSAVDGYAVRVDSREMTFTVVDHIRAGEWKPRSLERNQAVRIATGAALPSVGLQVFMKEDVEVSGAQITLTRRYRELNIRFRGDDARKGQTLIEPGIALGPGALALLAGLGKMSVSVTRLPRVLHVATGNEIVSPENTPLPGQIRDTNSILIRGFLRQWGIDVFKQSRLPEDETTARENLKTDATAQADILLVSGGASVGEHDFTRSLLEHLGYSIRICKTNTRPGKPLIFGTRGVAIAFGLPGNPLAHFVCLNLYVAAALRKLSGLPGRPPTLTGTLGIALEDIANPRETLWPSKIDYSSGAPVITPLRWSNSGDLTCLALANALALIPAQCDRLMQGATVEFFPIRSF